MGVEGIVEAEPGQGERGAGVRVAMRGQRARGERRWQGKRGGQRGRGTTVQQRRGRYGMRGIGGRFGVWIGRAVRRERGVGVRSAGQQRWEA